MSTQDHVACSIDSVVNWIGSNIVELEVDSLFCGDCGFGLSGSNGTESNKKFVVDSTSIVEERPKISWMRCL